MPQTNARRMTVQRRAVLDAVNFLGNHPTAEEIYDRVRSSFPGISLSTVYRNLGVLLEQGEIQAVAGPGNELHYDHRLEDHCHFHCSVCGGVADSEMLPSEAESLRCGMGPGYRIDSVYIYFTGVCPACLAGGKDEGK